MRNKVRRGVGSGGITCGKQMRVLGFLLQLWERWDQLEDFDWKSGRILLCGTDWRGPGKQGEASGRSLALSRRDYNTRNEGYVKTIAGFRCGVLGDVRRVIIGIVADIRAPHKPSLGILPMPPDRQEQRDPPGPFCCRRTSLILLGGQ